MAITSLVEYPTSLRAGIPRRERGWQHSIRDNRTGALTRLQWWDTDRTTFTVDYPTVDDDYALDIESFYVGTRNVEDFLFQDWLRPNPVGELIGVGDGTTRTFKVWGDFFTSVIVRVSGLSVGITSDPTLGTIFVTGTPPADGALVTADVTNEKYRVVFAEPPTLQRQGGLAVATRVRLVQSLAVLHVPYTFPAGPPVAATYFAIAWYSPSSLLRSTDGITFAPLTISPSLALAWFDEWDATLRRGLGIAAGDRQTVYETTDGGTTWNPLVTPLPEDFTDGGTAAQGSIVRVPATGTLLATLISVGTGTRVARSADHGVTWSTIVVGGMASRQGEWFTFHVTTNGSILLHSGTGGNPVRVWRSTDDGQSWATVIDTADGGGGPVTVSGAVAFFLRNITGGSQIRRSADNGATWATVATLGGDAMDANYKYRSNPALQPNGTFRAVVRDTPGATTLHYTSADGITWGLVSTPATFPAGPKLGSLTGVPGTSATVLFVDRIGGGVLHKSLDNGATWASEGAATEVFTRQPSVA